MTLMASAISAPTASSSSSSLSSFTSKRLSFSALSNSSISAPKVQLLKWIPYSGLTPFSSWNGLKQLSISKSQYSVQIGRSRKHKGKGVYASLFGVGAPEALVIGVVALLVFGPKGLAELKFGDSEVVNFKSFTRVQVARNLGKTLREFQPTIRELQEVSRDFKSTLEREIGLDDIKGSGQDTIKSSTTLRQEVDPNGSPSPSIASSSEEDMERLLRIAEAEKQADKDLASLLESQSESRTVSQVADNTSSSDRAYSTEEYLKITEEQLKAAAQQQNETSIPEQSPFNAQSLSQDNSSSSDGAYSTEEVSKITELQLSSPPQQSPSNVQSQSQETLKEAASPIPSSQKPESET